jgi:hypothetical protein
MALRRVDNPRLKMALRMRPADLCCSLKLDIVGCQMNRLKRAAPILVLPLLVTHALSEPMLKEVSIMDKVPAGTYVQSDNPECGIPSSFPEILNHADVLEATSKTLGVRAGAVLIVITQADDFFRKNGGALSKYYNKALGRKDGASCATFCLKVPSGAEPISVWLSDRNGHQKFVLPFKDGTVLDNQTTYDWSGWRNVTTASNQDGTIVCGIATNWDAKRDAIKRMAVQYRTQATPTLPSE